MTTRFAVLGVCVLFALGACSRESAPNTATTTTASISALSPASAAQDARNALALGDRHVFAVRGFTLEIPGTALTVTQARQMYGVQVLDSTRAASAADAATYAAEYNAVVVGAK